MNTPDPALMGIYGTDTYFLEKVGAVTSQQALQVAAPLAFLGMVAVDKGRRLRLLQEADLMNRMFRAVESQRMQGVRDGLEGKYASVGRFLACAEPGELEKVAMEIGTRLAREASELEKKALVGAAVGMLGRALGAGGKALGGGGGQFLRRQGINLRSAARGRGAAPAPMSLSQGARQGFTAGSPTGASPWAAASAAAPTAVAGKKSLLGWKGKAGLGAATLGAGYAGYKGLQATRDYMMTPTSQERWGRHGVAPAHNVSPYGYVTPTM
jgi:hypothetical protein